MLLTHHNRHPILVEKEEHPDREGEQVMVVYRGVGDRWEIYLVFDEPDITMMCVMVTGMLTRQAERGDDIDPTDVAESLAAAIYVTPMAVPDAAIGQPGQVSPMLAAILVMAEMIDRPIFPVEDGITAVEVSFLTIGALEALRHDDPDVIDDPEDFQTSWDYATRHIRHSQNQPLMETEHGSDSMETLFDGLFRARNCLMVDDEDGD